MSAPIPSDIRKLVASAVCVHAATFGCAGDPGRSPPLEAPDGVAATIDAVPVLRLGVSSGDTLQEFHRVVTPFRMEDGRVVVPLAAANVIRVFSPEGHFIGSLGGPGRGPGEFVGLSGAWARGDTIEAFDSRLPRITRFGPDGSVEVVTLVDPPRSAQVALPSAFPDGWLLAGVADAPMGGRDRTVVHLFGRDGAHLGEVAEVEGMARVATPMLTGPHPLSPRAVFRLDGATLYVAETLSPAISVVDLHGAEERRVTWEPEGVPSADVALRSIIDSAVARAAPEDATATRRRLESFPPRERVSVFWDFIVDRRTLIWIRPYEPGRHGLYPGGSASAAGTGGRWLVLSPTGARLGVVDVPDHLEPVRITEDEVVGISRDPFGVESVHVHRLHRR